MLSRAGFPVLNRSRRLFHPDTLLVMLQSERHALPGALTRSVVLHCENRYWKEWFRFVAQRCRALVLLPETTNGVLEELDEIIAGQDLSRTIVTMGPSHKTDRPGRLLERVGGWEEIRRDFLARGVNLPEYDAAGRLVVLLGDAANPTLCRYNGGGFRNALSQVPSRGERMTWVAKLAPLCKRGAPPPGGNDIR
jgi:hypothetical protein